MQGFYQGTSNLDTVSLIIEYKSYFVLKYLFVGYHSVAGMQYIQLHHHYMDLHDINCIMITMFNEFIRVTNKGFRAVRYLLEKVWL